jgi:transcription initiation factor TFIIE subunit alpha
MEMLKKFLKDIIVIVAGKQAEEIVDLLDGNKYVNEFIIAKKLDITINQTRNILYKISDYGLVSSIRKKDKKKGWYTYFWKIEILKSLEFLKDVLVKKLDQLNHQIKSRETKEFYVCERCSIEFNAENAMLHDFTCNECGDIFSLKDNSKVLREFKRNIDKLQKELNLLEEEIKKEQEKLDKKKLRELKKQKAEKELKLAEKRLIAKKKRELKKDEEKKKMPLKKEKSSKKITKKTSKKKVSLKTKKKIVKKVVKKKVARKIKLSKKAKN